MLNAEIATISHIEMPERWSVVQPVLTPGDLARAVSDLGNRASDIVQSNFVIWVEGPSDRLYVRQWLKLHDPELIEGAHYSVMFYGGVLLSHLTVDDEEAEDFINLLRINRNLAVVIDSDRKRGESDLNATKNRVIGELERIGAPAWVTEGYTIENYLPEGIVREAISTLYPNRTYIHPRGIYCSPLGRFFVGTETKPSKTTVARHIIDQDMMWEDLSAHLRQNLAEISTQIRASNGLLPRKVH